MEWIFALVAAAVTLVIAIPVTAKVSVGKYKKEVEEKLGNADTKARQIIDDALKTAEEKKRESMLEVKEETIKAKNDLDRELKERRNEITRSERRIQQKEESIDKKRLISSAHREYRNWNGSRDCHPIRLRNLSFRL